MPIGLSLQEMERRLIEATLERFDGHRAKTAEALGIGLRTLTTKLKEYGRTDEAAAIGGGRLMPLFTRPISNRANSRAETAVRDAPILPPASPAATSQLNSLIGDASRAGNAHRPTPQSVARRASPRGADLATPCGTSRAFQPFVREEAVVVM